MIVHYWPYIGTVLLAVVALLMAAASPAQAPSAPPPVATPSNTSDTRRGPTPARPEIGERPVVDATRVADTRPDGRGHRELLKRYEEAWGNPDPAKLRTAEEELLRELKDLPPPELVALLGQGLSTRSVNLVLITLENAMRGTRRSDYEDALVAGMEEVFEQPDKLEALSDVTLRFSPSRENAEVAARLLMKRGPAGTLAEHLGRFAARLPGAPRREVKQFGVKHDLIETIGYLVEEGSDVARLQGYLRDPATRDRAWRALEKARESVTDEGLRQQIQRALGK
jgi:hypothetical protein